MGKVMSLATEHGLVPVSRSVSLPPHQGEVQQVLGSGNPTTTTTVASPTK